MASNIMNIRIRQATIDDAPAIASLHAQSFLAANADDITPETRLELESPDYTVCWEKRLRDPNNQAIVAENEGELLGFVTVVFPEPQQPEILYLYVAVGHWREGVGRRLVSYVMQWLKTMGHTSVMIWVSKTSKQAQTFYTSQGAQFTGEEKVVERRHVRLHQILYRLPL